MTAYPELAQLLETIDISEVNEENRDAAYQHMVDLRLIAKNLNGAADDLEDRIAATIPFGDHAVLGGKAHGAYRDVRYYDYDHDGLEHRVLDSRVADRDGVLVDETEADRLRAVYPHRGYTARKGELKRRNIDITEFCRVEKGRLKLREIR